MLIMTAEDYKELRDDIKLIREEITNILVQTALNTNAIKEMPGKIQSEINVIQLRYAAWVIGLIGSSGLIGWFLLN